MSGGSQSILMPPAAAECGAGLGSNRVPGTTLTLHPKIEDRDAFNPYSAFEIGVGTQPFLSEELPQGAASRPTQLRACSRA